MFSIRRARGQRPARSARGRKAAIALVLLAVLFGLLRGAARTRRPRSARRSRRGGGQPWPAGRRDVAGHRDAAVEDGTAGQPAPRRRRRRALLGARHRRHRRPARLLLARPVRASSAASTTSASPACRSRSRRLPGIDALIRPPAAAGTPVATPYNQYGMAGQYWAADQPAVLGHDVADRQRRGRDALRLRQGAGPGHDHRVPVGRRRGHTRLAAGRDRSPDQRTGQCDLLPLRSRSW